MDTKEFLNEVSKEPEHPFYESLRVTKEIVETSASCAWYFLKGLHFGEEAESRMINENTPALYKTAFEIGCQWKPVRDEVKDVVIKIVADALVAFLKSALKPS